MVALAGDGANSLVTLLVTVVIAQSTGLEGFARYSMSLLVYGSSVGVLHSVFADAAISGMASVNRERYFASTSLRTATVLGVLIGIWAFATHDWYLLAVASCLPGVTLFDYYRTIFRVRGEPVAALIMAIGVLVAVGLLSVLCLQDSIPTPLYFTGWLVSMFLVGIAVHISRVRANPGEGHDLGTFRAELQRSRWFAIDYLAGSGGAQIATLLTGIVVSPSLPAALRAAATLVGPLNVLSTTLRSLMIRHLADSVANGGVNLEWRNAKRVGVLSFLVWAPLMAATYALSKALGDLLLGDAWTTGSAVLGFVLVESWLAFLANVPAAGLRHRHAGKNSASLRVILGAIRPILFIVTSLAFGLMGLAWGLIGFSLINLVAWWYLYRSTLKKQA